LRTQRWIIGAAVGATGMVLAAVLSGTASAATDAPGCGGDENAGAHGKYCVDKIADVNARVGSVVHAHVAITLPSCPDATAALVQARIIVAGENGHGGTIRRLHDAQVASDKAHSNVTTAENADRTEDAADAAAVTQAQSDLDAAKAEVANSKDTTKAVPAKYADRIAWTKAATDAQDAAQGKFDAANKANAGSGAKEAPKDDEDAAVARAKAEAFDADKRLSGATDAEGRAEQGVVDAELVIGQACPKPPPPATDTPAPAQPTEIIYPGTSVAGQPPAAGDTTVETHLPVTG
jgi:hypothetical protein